jgi:hypothetical protein
MEIVPKLRLLSLGAGVQSTTLALMVAAGEFADRIDGAIFADTQWEPAEVYAHLDRLEKLLPFPVYRVTAGNIRTAMITRRNTTGGHFAAVPWFTVNPDGSKGMGRRQCTSEYKLKPIMWKVRELLGVTRTAFIRAASVEQWIGISTDEATRMKDAKQRYIVNRWPLIERGMSRADCLQWLTAHGHAAPSKSACVGCPFHDQATWERMMVDAPAQFEEAVAIDAQLRQGDSRGMRAIEFMHPARLPLRQAVEESHALKLAQPDLFAALECEGMCGV